MRPSAFAALERGAKRNKLGDTLQILDRHVDFVALAAEMGCAAPRLSRSRVHLVCGIITWRSAGLLG